jgi:catechol 2,3-dioxygenase-like lactoylglutathione lyase family enzyme
MATVSVRYIVDDVDAAIEFYRGQLGLKSRCTRRPPSPC